MYLMKGDMEHLTLNMI